VKLSFRQLLAPRPATLNLKCIDLNLTQQVILNSTVQIISMSKPTNYFFLSGLFFVVWLVVGFTDIYGDSGWFKAFLLILSTTYLMSGVAGRKKENKNNEPSHK
jgi:hypothetical protein